MLLAVRSRMLSIVARGRLPLTAHAPSHPPLHFLPVRRQGWWTPPGGEGGGRGGGGGLPPGFSSRWVTPTTYEMTVDMGQGSGAVSYDTSVGPNGDIHIKATWGDGQEKLFNVKSMRKSSSLRHLAWNLGTEPLPTYPDSGRAPRLPLAQGSTRSLTVSELETKGKYTLKVNVEPFKEDEIEYKLEDDQIKITGKIESKTGKSDFSYEMDTEVLLPSTVKQDTLKMKFDQGNIVVEAESSVQ